VFFPETGFEFLALPSGNIASTVSYQSPHYIHRAPAFATIIDFVVFLEPFSFPSLSPPDCPPHCEKSVHAARGLVYPPVPFHAAHLIPFNR
jgi:hypothetical protein